MNVARQFIAWHDAKRRAVPWGTVLWATTVAILDGLRRALDVISPRVTAHTVPYGTVLFCAPFQAVNCLATFIWSLRDNCLAAFILVPPGQPPGQLHLVPAGQHSLPPNLPRIQDEFRMRIH